MSDMMRETGRSSQRGKTALSRPRTGHTLPSSRTLDTKPAQPKNAERMSRNALDIARHVPAMLTIVASKISASASALYRPKFEVGITDWRILAHLAVEPWISAARLCEATGIDKGAISRSLGYMGKIGLVEMRADPDDQHHQFVALTKAGLARHDKIVLLSNVREEQLLVGFTESERKMLVDFLERMKRNSDAMLGAKAVKD
jgi:DNA-binding MarR family transcriptional regulator